MMEINPGLMLWTIINFILFFLLLKKFAWGPITKALDAREKGIKDNIESAQKARAEADKYLANYQKQLAEAQNEAQKIIAKARQDAERVRDELVSKSKLEADSQLERARKQIDLESQEAVNRIRAEMASLVIASAEKVIGRSLELKGQDQLIQDCLKGMEN